MRAERPSWLWLGLGMTLALAACGRLKQPRVVEDDTGHFIGDPIAPACPEGAACDDGDACTLDDVCTAGRCEGRQSETCGPRVEEWGTYTSVQASDGHALGGVHHEDAALPVWVHRRNFTDRQAYYFEALPREPLQQLETPVLYFWSPVARPVDVVVQFPRGVVGEWFPEATSFVPAVDHMKDLGGGAMSWHVDLDPAMTPDAFRPVDADEIWAPSRRVASTPLRWTPPGASGAEEREQFIFYRGLGTFEPPVRVVAGDGDGLLRITSSAAETVPAAFLLRVRDGSGRIARLGPLQPGVTLVAPVPITVDDLDTYARAAHQMLEDALVTSGLHPDVARAMVDTWTGSWFGNSGLRVLYLAPRPWTDAWLPTTITPRPSAYVRTLVGRIEVLTPEDERAVVAAVRAARPAPLDLGPLGRFAEPRLLRAVEMLTDADEVAYAQAQADRAHGTP